MEYTGGRTQNDIVNWILKKVGPPSTEVTCDELKKKVEENKLVAAYFGEKDVKEFTEVFQEVATHPSVSEKYQFFHTSDKECAQQFGATTLPALVVFRKFDESPIVYQGKCEVTPVIDWLLGSSVPTLITFSADYLEPIFGQKKPALFLFRSEEDSSADFSKTYEQAAKELKGEVLFAVSGIKEGIQQKLAEFIGVEANQLPMIMLLNPADNMKKFTFTESVKDL